MRNLSFGVKNEWKPYQKGIIITTQSFLDIADLLLNERGYKFVLGARFTSDCIENIFSVLRMKNCILNALQLKHNLKLITISHYMRHIASSSYDEDDREFLPDFLNIIKTSKKSKNSNDGGTRYVNIEAFDPQPDKNQEQNIVHLNKFQLNVLNQVAGYLMISISRTEKCCKKYFLCCGNLKATSTFYNRLTQLRCWGKKTLFFVNYRTFKFFMQMEIIFQEKIKNLQSFSRFNLRDYFIEKFLQIPYILPNCHELKKKIAKRFAVFRLKIHSKRRSRNRNPEKDLYYASKTMAMHANTK